MQRQRKLNVLALSLALGATSNAFGDGPTFTSIDFPGATTTNAWGINTRGDIVGSYLNPDKSDHGFLLSGGQYSVTVQALSYLEQSEGAARRWRWSWSASVR